MGNRFGRASVHCIFELGLFNPLDPIDEFTRHFGSLHLWKPFQAQRGSKTLPVCPNRKITGTSPKKWPFSGAPLL